MGWVFLIVVVLVFLIFHVAGKEKRRLEQEAEREAEQQRYREAQREYCVQMIRLGEDALNFFELIPKLLSSAEKHLDQAEVEFAEGAFAPFWDSIEKAAKTLGQFDESIDHIKGNSSRFADLITKYQNAPPKFPLSCQSVSKLVAGTATTERLKAIVRSAQRNFQFATIYEQRKTNQILVAGFTNLAQALDRMAGQITASIADLSSSVEAMSSTLVESLSALDSSMNDAAESTDHHYSGLMREVSAAAVRERKVVEMLDNIQRGRRPSL